MGEVARKTHGLYVDKYLFKGFTEYASRQYPLKSCEVWENALTEYMKNHPVENTSINIRQQIVSVLPQRMDVVNMGLLSPQIQSIMGRLEEKRGEELTGLKTTLAKLIRQGARIKHPSEEFTVLLEEAMKHI